MDDVSGDGRTILAYGGFDRAPYVLQGGVKTWLPSLGCCAEASRFSTDGRVVVGQTDCLLTVPIYWSDGAGPHELPVPANTTHHQMNAVNADGSMIVDRAGVAGENKAIRGVDGVPSTIDSVEGVNHVDLHDITPDGRHMVGGLWHVPGRTFVKAVRWSATKGFPVLESPPGVERTLANGQSADGKRTIVTVNVDSLEGKAVVWEETEALTEIHGQAGYDPRA